jgi:hypothetical protein
LAWQRALQCALDCQDFAGFALAWEFARWFEWQ